MARKRNLLLSLLISVFLLFGCNLPSSDEAPQINDPNAVFTAAAETASVQLTRAANVNDVQTPTPTPSIFLPTVTPSSGSNQAVVTATSDNCDKAKFVTDVSVPDGTNFIPGETYTKTWRVRNIGDCTWTSDYALVFDSGQQMSGVSPQLLMGSVAPGDTVDLSVELKAPSETGNYVGNWQLRNTSNVLFAKVYVQINVIDPQFAVTSVQNIEAFYITGRGTAFAADVTVNRAGKIRYYWIIQESGQPDLQTAGEELIYDNGGTKEISTLWTGCPHTGSFKASLYIDDPNNQKFGEVSFNCP